MTVEKINSKNDFIKLFRDNKFNCFPIPEHQKVADFRYKASRTVPNQTIEENENYGILPTKEGCNVIIDIDNKEKYRAFVEYMIEKGYMVIESPHGWHIPVINLTGMITKTELFDYTFQQKKIIEIQGYDHYCVGAESSIFDKDNNKVIKYENKGSVKIWDAGSIDFHQFIDELCKQCKVEAHKRSSRSSYKNLRERFLKGLIPSTGTSNDYFHQAGIQCNSDGLTELEATKKIKIIYDKWMQSEGFSGRPFSNIEAKIRDVYENNKKLDEGRPKKTHTIDRTEIAQNMIADRKLYSDVETHNIFENKSGFLEIINDTLKRELQRTYPEMEKSDYEAILFKLEGFADEIPETNKDVIVFSNGKYDKNTRKPVITDEIADMGFKDYAYLPPTKENEPTLFLKTLFENVDSTEHPRIKAGLKAILHGHIDSRISIIHGMSGVGKSTPLTILVKILGDYALPVELDQLLSDRFIRATIKGKRLVVLQDLPLEWKDFSQIKTMTGESLKTERAFHKESEKFDNKIKIWASGNYLAKIPKHEKNAMYTRRLSVIHNTKKEAYPENSSFIDDVTDSEGEKIISWIMNIPEEECKYEDAVIVKKEWESIASPEIEYLTKYWDVRTDYDESTVSIVSIMRDFESKVGKEIELKQMKDALENQGFIIKWNIVKNIMMKPEEYTKPIPIKSVNDY